MRHICYVFTALVCSVAPALANEWRLPYVALEFEDLGLSFEVPIGWYSLNNGVSKKIEKIGNEWMKTKGKATKVRTLATLLDGPELESKESSLISVNYIPTVLVSQQEVAASTIEQKAVILEHWRSSASKGLGQIAHSMSFVDDGEILKLGSNWFARLSIDYQMREDISPKRKDSFYYMYSNGVIVISISYVHGKEKSMAPIGNYICESLRANAIKRAY